MDAGELVPDDLVLKMVEERMAQPDCKDGLVLDGFPRTLHQAEEIEKVLHGTGQENPLLINFAVDTNQLLRRLTGRRTCTVGGEIYNIFDKPPKVDGKCDVDGGPLMQRPG